MATKALLFLFGSWWYLFFLWRAAKEDYLPSQVVNFSLSSLFLFWFFAYLGAILRQRPWMEANWSTILFLSSPSFDWLAGFLAWLWGSKWLAEKQKIAFWLVGERILLPMLGVLFVVALGLGWQEKANWVYSGLFLALGLIGFFLKRWSWFIYFSSGQPGLIFLAVVWLGLAATLGLDFWPGFKLNLAVVGKLLTLGWLGVSVYLLKRRQG